MSDRTNEPLQHHGTRNRSSCHQPATARPTDRPGNAYTDKKEKKTLRRRIKHKDISMQIRKSLYIFDVPLDALREHPPGQRNVSAHSYGNEMHGMHARMKRAMLRALVRLVVFFVLFFIRVYPLRALIGKKYTPFGYCWGCGCGGRNAVVVVVVDVAGRSSLSR